MTDNVISCITNIVLSKMLYVKYSFQLPAVTKAPEEVQKRYFCKVLPTNHRVARANTSGKPFFNLKLVFLFIRIRSFLLKYIAAIFNVYL